MGKRELLLVVAFLLVGVGVYHVAAPPADPGKPAFSIGALMAHVQSVIRGERAEVSVTRRAQVAAPAADDPIRLADYRGRVTIVGEDRADIEAELKAVVYGVDAASAQSRADKVLMDLDSSDAGVEVLLKSPDQMQRRPRFELTLRVPRARQVKLGLRSGEAEVRGVALLVLDEGRGKLTVLDTKRIEGEFQGDFSAQRVESAKVEVRRGDVRFEDVLGELELNAERADLTLTKIGGPVKVTAERLEGRLEDIDGAITIESDHANFTIRDPRAPLIINGIDADIRLTMSTAVPVTITNNQDTIDVRLPRQFGRLDVEATDGEIRTTDDRWTVEKRENVQKLDVKNGSGPVIKIRNEDANIILH